MKTSTGRKTDFVFGNVDPVDPRCHIRDRIRKSGEAHWSKSDVRKHKCLNSFVVLERLAECDALEVVRFVKDHDGAVPVDVQRRPERGVEEVYARPSG